MTYEAHENNKSGDQIYVTGGGDTLTCLEKDLVHPARDSGLVVKGDPVIAGDGITGVAQNSAVTEDDKIAVDRKTPRYLNATLTDGADLGNTLYIDKETAVISLDSSGYPFSKILADADGDEAAQIVPQLLIQGVEEGGDS